MPDREDSIIKKTVTFEVETWMPTRQYMIQSNGAIREMNYEVELKTDISFSGNGIPSESILATSGSETLVVTPLTFELIFKIRLFLPPNQLNTKEEEVYEKS